MKQYLKLLKTVLKKGELIENRTNINTISYFGTQTRYDISKSFPLLTTKKVYFKAIVHELLWFIKGDTNIKYLVDNNVRIWNEWPYEKFKNSKEYKNETIEEFAKKIKTNEDFAKKWGNLGPVYGKQWRNFDGVDQLINAINDLKNNPRSRRIIVSSWNPKEINNMALPPCHCFYQFYVNGNKLSCQLYQRSADLFLGVPFNIASYALLTYMVAQVTNLEPHEFIHTIGDAHIYENHIDQVKIQLKRRPKKLPTLKLNPNIKNILDFKFDDIQLIDYQPHEKIEAKVAV
ncbi:thymidylate synthase [Malacoplasma iowae]|uniref:Thymidylate synthase n=1 Tax=Malacoplasma iowae 695 TaxID=1048830 RepID=A0A6P1LCY9_MALIO|nr:thymidylate synthase [Malacoplasma iowae]VEU61582.1 Thymidylate synthase [Mycoplasmopsis fermentans]EGZ31320.1 thymidylate synthase [Malacoplasma iowae 695]QHG89325.1 thymidylate synthase [Malacoplasma iowae 695]QHG90256.1 thymidylate synthase [Malacoplasma iowae 695]WPL35973.1 thymidylate synthase [Malacoplasma iowae]